jgi:hypothetical protein
MKSTAAILALLVGAASFSTFAMGTKPIVNMGTKPIINMGTKPITNMGTKPVAN